MAAVSWTIVGGAAAFVVIVNVTVPWPGAATTDAGTVATDGSLLRSRTVVAVASSGMRVTVPCEDAPFRTESGETESAEMMPVARALVGTTSSTVKSPSAVRTESRRTAAPLDRWPGGQLAIARALADMANLI